MVQLVFHQYLLARRLPPPSRKIDRPMTLCISHVWRDSILKKKQEACGAAVVRCCVHRRIAALVSFAKVLTFALEKFAKKLGFFEAIGCTSNKQGSPGVHVLPIHMSDPGRNGGRLQAAVVHELAQVQKERA